MRLDKLMYEYIFKGYSIFSNEKYTYQVLSDIEDKVTIFTNDVSLSSDSVFKIKDVNNLFNYTVTGSNVFDYLSGENDTLDHIDLLYSCKKEKDIKKRFYKYLILTNDTIND